MFPKKVRPFGPSRCNFLSGVWDEQGHASFCMYWIKMMVQHCTYIKSPCQEEEQNIRASAWKIFSWHPRIPQVHPSATQPLSWAGTLFQVMAQVAGASVRKEWCEEKINMSQVCSSDMRGWEVAFLSYSPCYCGSWALQCPSPASPYRVSHLAR